MAMMQDWLVIDGRVVATFEVDDEIGQLVRGFEASFTARTESELRTLSVLLGGIDRYAVGTSGKTLFSPADLVTEGGRDVRVWIWLEDELAPVLRVPVPPVDVVAKVRQAAKEHRELAAVTDG